MGLEQEIEKLEVPVELFLVEQYQKIGEEHKKYNGVPLGNIFLDNAGWIHEYEFKYVKQGVLVTEYTPHLKIFYRMKKGKIEIVPPSCYGTINKNINTGVNYVTIPVYCGGAII